MIRNDGKANLIVGSIVLEKNSGFTIVKQPVRTIAPGKTTTFILRMLSVGTKSATVKFTSNDADESTFNFNITGVVAR